MIVRLMSMFESGVVREHLLEQVENPTTEESTGHIVMDEYHENFLYKVLPS